MIASAARREEGVCLEQIPICFTIITKNLHGRGTFVRRNDALGNPLCLPTSMSCTDIHRHTHTHTHTHKEKGRREWSESEGKTKCVACEAIKFYWNDPGV